MYGVIHKPVQISCQNSLWMAPDISTDCVHITKKYVPLNYPLNTLKCILFYFDM